MFSILSMWLYEICWYWKYFKRKSVIKHICVWLALKFWMWWVFLGFKIRQRIGSNPGGRVDQDTGGATGLRLSPTGLEPGSSGTQLRAGQKGPRVNSKGHLQLHLNTRNNYYSGNRQKILTIVISKWERMKHIRFVTNNYLLITKLMFLIICLMQKERIIKWFKNLFY